MIEELRHQSLQSRRLPRWRIDFCLMDLERVNLLAFAVTLEGEREGKSKG